MKRVVELDAPTARTELRHVRLFADLADEQVDWLAAQATFIDFEPGDITTAEGDPAVYMYALIRGELRGKREQKRHGGADSWLYVWKAGDVTGMMPFSRITHMPITARAVMPTRMAFIPASVFPEMLTRIPVLLEPIVHLMLDRARSAVRDEQENQSLSALGRIAAGLAHELYNPTSAVLRAASELRERFKELHRCSIALAHHNVHDDALRMLVNINQNKSLDEVRALNTVARGEAIEQIGEWLDDRGVKRAWSLAETFLEAGLGVDDLERICGAFTDESLSDALNWLDVLLASDSLLQDVENGAKRVSALVSSVKSYSYLDRQTEKVETDLHAALDSTLKILAHKLRDKNIIVEREFDLQLPTVIINAGEMNQVWTNLIDNAIDAVGDGGRITLRTAQEPLQLVVEIADNGPGISKDIQSRIWEPFFTTKDVGKGTGLGLDIVRRIIVLRHQGEIRVESVPGDTRFQVRLPRQIA